MGKDMLQVVRMSKKSPKELLEVTASCSWRSFALLHCGTGWFRLVSAKLVCL